jgi:hypothetical protein
MALQSNSFSTLLTFSLTHVQGDTTSAESFEKTLSALSIKISKASTSNESLRQRSRKLKVGWTLYGGFSYILALLIFFLVTGWRNWGPMELSVVSGGPVLLYAVRYLLNAWYTYRMNNSQDYLETLYKDRDETIEKLKAATKYDSTQKLLEKYGGKGASPGSGKKDGNKTNGTPKGQQKGAKADGSSPKQTPEKRVFMNPPPTANIQRKPTTPSQEPPEITEEFAPNAYEDGHMPSVSKAPTVQSGFQPPPIEPAQYQQPVVSSGGWMDRLVTALMGEDETLPTNRLALLCTSCRMVNGLAPPGIRTPEELGKWRCASCGAWNGVEQQQPIVLPVVASPDSNEEDEEEEVKEESKPKPKSKKKGGAKKAKKENDDDEDDE